MASRLNKIFSWRRTLAMITKEFFQMRRDRLTFAMIIGIPLIQLTLFGYAINTNPHNLPTAVVYGDNSMFVRQFIVSLKNTDYFQVIAEPKTIKQAEEMLATNKVLFVVSFPPDFTRNLLKGNKPQLLVEADATDPVATGNALSAIQQLAKTVFDPYFQGPTDRLRTEPVAVNLITHSKYNPENITQYNIVPALLGVVLTMTMVIITSLAITRERERGTMESLLATPVRPIEVMIGKLLPYIVVGYIQVFLILFAAKFLFHVPNSGSIVLLIACVFPFIAANLAVGLTFSSLAQNQLQAMQLAFFFFLPSILLSGFMFPFAGMPKWAQMLGNILPLTYFIRIVRGILLKGNSAAQIWQSVWPILVFGFVAIFVGVKRYRQTLD